MRTKTWLAAFVLAAGLFAGCRDTNSSNISAKSEGNPDEIAKNPTIVRATNDVGTGSVKSVAISKDDELGQRIRVVLSTGTTGLTGTIPDKDLLPINVAVSNGAVILTGKVSSESDKALAGKWAAGVAGVTSVQNNLEISPDVRPLQGSTIL